MVSLVPLSLCGRCPRCEWVCSFSLLLLAVAATVGGVGERRGISKGRRGCSASDGSAPLIASTHHSSCRILCGLVADPSLVANAASLRPLIFSLLSLSVGVAPMPSRPGFIAARRGHPLS